MTLFFTLVDGSGNAILGQLSNESFSWSRNNRMWRSGTSYFTLTDGSGNEVIGTDDGDLLFWSINKRCWVCGSRVYTLLDGSGNAILGQNDLDVIVWNSDVRQWALGVGSPPTVEITSPAPGTLLPVAITATFTGTCSSDVTRLVFFYNGVQIGTGANSGGNWTFKWSPGLLRAGTSNFVARAYRGSVFTDSSPLSISVDNIPLRSIYGTGGGIWLAEDLAYNDGAVVAEWTSRINGLKWTSATATMLSTGWATPAGTEKCVALRVASSAEMNCDALAPLFQGTDPPVTVILVMQVPSGLGTGTQMWFTATSTASSTPKWLYQHVGLTQRVAKQTTTRTFASTKNLAIDFGQHMYVATDTGTAVNVWRDSGALMNADTPQALDVLDAAINTVNLGVQNNAGVKVNRADMNIKAVVVVPTASLAQADFQYILNFIFGNYNQDQYYGDSTTPYLLANFSGQSNTQGLAVSTLPAIPAIRFFFRSNNNWLSDPLTLQDLAPQAGFIGYWYQGAINLQAQFPNTPVHVCGLGSGAQFCDAFYDFPDDGYYSTGLFDEWCRNLETAKALLGGSPTYRLIWGQGESDAQNVVAAGAYLANVTQVFSFYETRLGVGVPSVVIQLNGTSPGQPYAADVQAAEASFVAGRAHTALVPTTDIVFPTNFISVLHYNEAGQVIVGGRAGSASVP